MKNSRIAAIAIAAVVVLLGGYYQFENKKETVFEAVSLPSSLGRVDGSSRFAEPGIERPGYLNFGPYVMLDSAKYKITLKYSSSAPKTETVGVFDVFNLATGSQLIKHELLGTEGADAEYTAEFNISDPVAQKLEFRNNWLGKHQLKIYQIRLKKD